MSNVRVNHFPYCLQKINDDIGGWIILNRRYKPLGVSHKTWAVYEDVPKELRIASLSVEEQERLSYQQIEGDTIYLYNDGCVPEECWPEYRQKLEILSTLECFNKD